MTRTEIRPRESAHEALDGLDDRDRARLLSLAHQILGCHHLAEDALQDALLDLSRQEEMPERPAAWLSRAIVFRCRHLRRTLRRRTHHEHVASEHCRLHGDCDNPLHVAMAHELGDMLTAMRECLPPEQQRPFELFTCQGKDYLQISELLGVPVGTVRSRLSRARERLSVVVQQWQAI